MPFFGTSLILGLGLIYLYITDTRASFHRWLVVPALRILYPDPEDAHHAGNSALKTLWYFGLYPRERGDPDKRGDLEVEVFGHALANPIATSTGIDKHAESASRSPAYTSAVDST
jgi:dihydroorotate dehydrogenase